MVQHCSKQCPPLDMTLNQFLPPTILKLYPCNPTCHCVCVHQSCIKQKRTNAAILKWPCYKTDHTQDRNYFSLHQKMFESKVIYLNDIYIYTKHNAGIQSVIFEKMDKNDLNCIWNDITHNYIFLRFGAEPTIR